MYDGWKRNEARTDEWWDKTKVSDIHDDLRQLSYGSVIVRSYGRYDVNGFRFRSAPFEAARP
jgi:hypothetical protein